MADVDHVKFTLRLFDKARPFPPDPYLASSFFPIPFRSCAFCTHVSQHTHTHPYLTITIPSNKQTNTPTANKQDDIGSDEPLGDLDLDLQALFPILNEATGEREFIVERKWIPLR